MPVAKTTIGIVSVTAVGDDYLDFDLYVGVSPYFIKLGSYSYSASTFTPTGANGSAFGQLTVIITITVNKKINLFDFIFFIFTIPSNKNFCWFLRC